MSESTLSNDNFFKFDVAEQNERLSQLFSGETAFDFTRPFEEIRQPTFDNNDLRHISSQSIISPSFPPLEMGANGHSGTPFLSTNAQSIDELIDFGALGILLPDFQNNAGYEFNMPDMIVKTPEQIAIDISNEELALEALALNSIMGDEFVNQDLFIQPVDIIIPDESNYAYQVQNIDSFSLSSFDNSSPYQTFTNDLNLQNQSNATSWDSIVTINDTTPLEVSLQNPSNPLDHELTLQTSDFSTISNPDQNYFQ